jgi:septal ring factor EnvC (AmiA/AmiB activator)/cell division protein FtsX
MSWSQMSFVVSRASSNLRGLIWTHTLTSGTMAMTLFIFGAFMLLETNLQGLLKGWGDQIQLNAYLKRGLGGGEVESLLNRVRALPEVLRVRHITQEQAWRDFRAALGAQSNVLEGLPPDVLPSSFEIAVKPGFRDALGVERLAARLEQEKGITLVEYPRDWIDRLSLLLLAVEWVKWLLAGALFVITLFIVGSTVKLAILARTDEIEIMQLVGSSRTMIQAPFVIEGMVLGLVGGAAAVAGLWGAFELARQEVSFSGSVWGAPNQWRFLDINGITLILLLGWLLGSAGSLFSLRRLIRTWRALAFAFVLIPAVTLNAASVEKDLEGIKKKIEKEKQGISRARKEEGSLLQSLERIEGELERKTGELKEANSKLDSIAAELQEKQAKAELIESSIKKRRELFNERAVALYRWHRSGSPFMIFSGDVPLGVFLQRKRYLETALAFDRDLVTQLSKDAQAQERLREELAQKKDELDGQRKKLAGTRESIRREGNKKKELLASVRQEKATRTRALKELEQAALRLQRMIDELSRRAVSKPPAMPPGVGLGALYGKLDWPVKGELLNGFGKTRHREFAAEVFRNGIDIGAPLGQDIKAVEKGTVAFADRFAGYGKMIIVDHGERYYTVYAHLSEIRKKIGDSVKRGETLGLVGDSDSLAGAKLYFELRKDGRSVDPLPWFKK